MNFEKINPPVVTHAMKEMLANCRDRAQLQLSPRLDYDLETSKKLADIGYLQPRAIVGQGGNAGMAFFVTKDGADYLSRLQIRVVPMVNIPDRRTA